MNNRWLKIGLLATSVFLLVACGSKTETQDDTETPGYTESWGVLSDEEHQEFVEKFAELKNT